MTLSDTLVITQPNPGERFWIKVLHKDNTLKTASVIILLYCIVEEAISYIFMH